MAFIFSNWLKCNFFWVYPGIKKSSEVNGEIHLQASGFFKDIRIQMLSDDNFSEVCFILLYLAKVVVIIA